jgi:hypothetical protein
MTMMIGRADGDDEMMTTMTTGRAVGSGVGLDQIMTRAEAVLWMACSRTPTSSLWCFWIMLRMYRVYHEFDLFSHRERFDSPIECDTSPDHLLDHERCPYRACP